jgi:hypothetical protein
MNNDLSREYKVLGRKTIAIEDNGMAYEADLIVYENSPFNISRGATLRYFSGRDVFKLRRDGTRGRKLVICGKRKSEFGYEEMKAFEAEILASLEVRV